jgi:hypothetical protein
MRVGSKEGIAPLTKLTWDVDLPPHSSCCILSTPFVWSCLLLLRMS